MVELLARVRIRTSCATRFFPGSFTYSYRMLCDRVLLHITGDKVEYQVFTLFLMVYYTFDNTIRVGFYNISFSRQKHYCRSVRKNLKIHRSTSSKSSIQSTIYQQAKAFPERRRLSFQRWDSSMTTGGSDRTGKGMLRRISTFTIFLYRRQLKYIPSSCWNHLTE